MFSFKRVAMLLLELHQFINQHKVIRWDVSICCCPPVREGRGRQRCNRSTLMISRIGELLAPNPGGWASPWRRCPGAPGAPGSPGGGGGGGGCSGEPFLLLGSPHPGLAGLLAGSRLKKRFFFFKTFCFILKFFCCRKSLFS